MERPQKRNAIQSRKKEVRALVKKCFRNNLFSFVPFEIWKDIVFEVDLEIMKLLSQTCWGFKELIDDFLNSYLDYAKRLRKEGEIDLALAYLRKCAVLGNAVAMFHLGYASYNFGWGVKISSESIGWFEKSAKRGNPAAMAWYAYLLQQKCERWKADEFFDADGDLQMLNEQMQISVIWAKKALDSGHSYAAAFCYGSGIGTPIDQKKTFELLQISAEEGDEFGQGMLGLCYRGEFGTTKDNEKAFYWYKKSAEQGLSTSQRFVGTFLRNGIGCESNAEEAREWFGKAASQGDIDALVASFGSGGKPGVGLE